MTTQETDSGWPGDERSDEDLADRGAPVLGPCLLEGVALQLDPYVGCAHQCRYCYALAQKSGGWLEGVRAYDGLARRLEAELLNLKRQTIYLGWYSDPYQPIEGERRDTRSALRTLSEAGFSATILTKSDLVTRDLDVLSTMPGSSVGISLAFADERARRPFEPGAPPNARRIDALRAAKAARIETYALVCPVMPHLTDVPALLRSVEGLADRVWVYRFEVRDRTSRNWRNVLKVIGETFPEIENRFVAASLAREHAYWSDLREVARNAAVDLGISLRAEF
jgi:DNA repair photolyase